MSGVLDTLRRLAARMRGEWAGFALAALLMSIVAATNGVSIWVLKPVVDVVLAPGGAGDVALEEFGVRVVEGPRRAVFLLLLGFFVASRFAMSVAAYGHRYLTLRTAERVVARLRVECFEHMVRLSPGYYVRARAGDLLSRLTSDVALVQQLVGRSLADLLRRPLEIAVLTGFLVLLNPRLCLLALLVAPPVLFAANRLGASMRRGTRRIQEKVADLAVRFHEVIEGIRIVQGFRGEAREVARFRGETEEYLRRALRTGRVDAATNPLMEAITAVGIAAVILVGGLDVLAGRMTPGALFTFSAMLMATYQPAKTLVGVLNDLQRAGAALDRIDAVLAEIPAIAEAPGARDLPPLDRSIRFRGVRFSYGEAPVLDRVDVEIRRGERVAIVGPSGAGKSTLLNLVPRFLDPTEGSVEIDGVDLQGATLESLRGRIGIVTQETVLFHDTIAANVAYARPEAPRAAIEAAARIANAHDFVARLPEGYETVVGERGVRLSGGERQRIAIARAMLADPPILLLDEATSALDSAAEREVQEALGRARAGRTTVEVAHRLSTVAGADRIVVLDGGRVVEEGRHADLLARGGLYARLWALQAEAGPAR